MERTPMQRYEWATGPDGWLTANGWERLAADLESAATLLAAKTPIGHDAAAKLRDRAADCRARRLRLIVAYEQTLPSNGY